MTGSVVVRDLVRLEAADSKLIRELHALYDEDLSAGRIPDNYRYMSPSKLAERLDGIQEATLRRRVSRCREAVERAYRQKWDRGLPSDALIENKPWKGYRLNPNVRFVMITEIDVNSCVSQTAAAAVTDFPAGH
jgi:hypothetical protein